MIAKGDFLLHKLCRLLGHARDENIAVARLYHGLGDAENLLGRLAAPVDDLCRALAQRPVTVSYTHLRLAQEEDIPAIWEITQEAFLKYADALGSRGKVKALLETQQDILLDMQKKVVLIGLVGGKPMGSIRLEAMGDVAYISRFGVRTSAPVSYTHLDVYKRQSFG